jgi:hypothetical protein
MTPRARPPNGVERPNGQPGRSTTRLLTDQTRISAIVADDGDGVLVDLDDRRARRLLRPWSGWWAGTELSTWTWAERTRCGDCA